PQRPKHESRYRYATEALKQRYPHMVSLWHRPVAFQPPIIADPALAEVVGDPPVPPQVTCLHKPVEVVNEIVTRGVVGWLVKGHRGKGVTRPVVRPGRATFVIAAATKRAVKSIGSPPCRRQRTGSGCWPRRSQPRRPCSQCSRSRRDRRYHPHRSQEKRQP